MKTLELTNEELRALTRSLNSRIDFLDTYMSNHKNCNHTHMLEEQKELEHLKDKLQDLRLTK